MSAPDLSHAIREAILAGNKILAIKLYREQTGLGLAEAKDAVERMESQLQNLSAPRPSQPVESIGPGAVPDHSAAIREAILAGNKILAIKLHREQTGVGLKQAKDAVEMLEA